MKTFTCWPTMRIMHYVLNWKILKGTKGKCHWILRNRDLYIVWANLNMRIILNIFLIYYSLYHSLDMPSIHTLKYIRKPIITNLRLTVTREMLAILLMTHGMVQITVHFLHIIVTMTEALWIVPVCLR